MMAQDNEVIAPVFTGPLCDAWLRFFCAPFFGANVPWLSASDLFDCLKVTAEAGSAFLKSWEDETSIIVRSIITEAGETKIVPSWFGPHLIDLLVEAGDQEPGTSVQFLRLTRAAWRAYVATLPPQDEETLLAIAIAKMQNPRCVQ